MKKLLLIALFAVCSIQGFSQGKESDARLKIQAIRGVKLNEVSNYALSNTFTSIADLSAKKILTAAELRAGGADTVRAVLITDPAIRGIFYKTPGSSAVDNGTTVFVVSGNRFIKDTTEQTALSTLTGTVSGLASSKQNVLVAGSNIKNIDGNPIVGSGNISTRDLTTMTGTLPTGSIPASVATATSTHTLTNKTVDGDDNTVRDLPQSATKFLSDSLAKKANNTQLTEYMKLSATNTVAGANVYSTTQRYQGTWANKQIIAGGAGQSGTYALARGSDGSTQARFGYKSAGENNVIEAFAPGGSGAFEINTNGGTGLKVFADSRTVFQRGGTYTNTTLHDFQFNGSSKFSGPMEVANPIILSASVKLDTTNIKAFATNAAAVADLGVGMVYKRLESDGRYSLNLTHYANTDPIFGEKVSSGNTRVFWPGASLEQSYKAQSANEDHNIRRATNKTAPFYRFEVRQFENWPSDIGIPPSCGNCQNGLVKERTEMYQEGASIPFNQDVWVSYSIYIEPGADITYGGNADYYCMLGQWHPGDGIPSGGPSWGIELLGQGSLNLFTRGQENLVPPFTGGRPWAVDRANITVSRGAWHNIVVRARHNKNSGQIDWWVDNNPTPVYTATNIPIGNDHTVIGYWKFGIYRTSNANTLAVRYANMEVKVDATNSNTVNSNTLKDRILNPLPL
jgi:hypothetical protein